ncbi:MAG: 5'/3'-nucleotidase SurE [Gammaproteobacteria bacterium]|nr:5'/3'-nucleotidase SurE [Gammaproteobacteria bacterium]MBT8151750.1 5'/3'-nucleotidase SurE [Gammaproteobacteria bacterium]NND38977.1 hypothetical protein [Pseudomonadales bacterium]NNM10959.1 hypothetical protein [Pseudomonadales bacterium]
MTKKVIRPQTFFVALMLSLVSTHVAALNIALTNDDGWDSQGIQTLRAALLSAGHKVTLAGSSENQSGSSAAIDFGQGNVLVTKKFEDGEAAPGGDQYAVSLSSGAGAEPATAGQIAIAIAGQGGAAVDLLISGTNAGANVGAFTNVSGTVGATIHGISLTTGARLPAIAISTNEPQPMLFCPVGNRAQCEAANLSHFEVVADWMIKFIAALEKQPGKLKKSKRLLPDGIALNINYPVSDEILGVQSNVQGRLPSMAGRALGLPLGCYGDCAGAAVNESIPAGVLEPKVLDGVEERKNADTAAFEGGYVSIVVINTDLTASKAERKLISRLVKNLNAKY